MGGSRVQTSVSQHLKRAGCVLLDTCVEERTIFSLISLTSRTCRRLSPHPHPYTYPNKTLIPHRMSEEEAKHIHELETKEHLAGEDDADSVSSGGSFSRKMSRTSAGKHRLRISERKASTFDRTGTKLDEVVPEVTPAPTLHVPEQNTHSADEEKVAEGEGDNNTNKDTPAEEAPNATIGAAKEALKHLDDEANQGEDRADEVTYVPRPFHSVALFKIHHCIGDGIGLVEVLKEIINAKVMTFRKQGSGKLRRNEGSCSLVCKAFNSICKISSMTLPWASFDSPISFTGGAEAGHLARGSGCMGTSPAPLTYSGKRSTVHFPEVSLQLIKEIKSKIGNSCSVNDVLLGVVGGVLRRLSESRNDPLLGDNQMVNRCLIPFAFPRGAESIDDDHDGPRNMWTMVSAAIPVTGTSAVKRVKMAQRTMKEIKQSPDAYVAQWIQENGLSTKDLVHGLFARHTCVFTNVPGPTEEIRFGGAKVKGIQMLFPNIIPQLSVLSYANKMYFNFNIDKEVCKGWEQLPQFYMEELAELANDLDLDKKLVAFEHISSRGGPFHRSRHEAQGDLNAPKLAAATAPKMVTPSTTQRTFKAPSSRSGQPSEKIASLEA